MPRCLIVDSSVLIYLDRKGKLKDFLRQKDKENCKVIIPKAIAQELIEEPEAFAEEIKGTAPELADKISDSAARIRTAIQQGLIEVQTVDYVKYSKVMDNVRKHLSKLDSKPEYEVKKGDPELIALVIQIYNQAKEKVFVATLDKGLVSTLKSFSGEVDFKLDPI